MQPFIPHALLSPVSSPTPFNISRSRINSPNPEMIYSCEICHDGNNDHYEETEEARLVPHSTPSGLRL